MAVVNSQVEDLRLKYQNTKIRFVETVYGGSLQ